MDTLPSDLQHKLARLDQGADVASALIRGWSCADGQLPAAMHELREDVLVAGIPCVDYSLMGTRRCMQGPSFVLILAWSFIMRQLQPLFAIVENIVQFPTDLLDKLNGDLPNYAGMAHQAASEIRFIVSEGSCSP